MDVFDAIYHRHAIREFKPQVPNEAVIGSLIEAAVQAPSAMNLQPWAFAVVRGRERLAGISDRAKAHLLKTMAAQSPLEAYRSHLSDPAFDIFYGAPTLIMICAISDAPGASEDCALAAQTLMLAAHASGLGTCWIGFARPWLNEAEAKSEIGLPASYAPVAPIILGYPKGTPVPHPRREPEIIWIGD
jgi:nitroreductase